MSKRWFAFFIAVTMGLLLTGGLHKMLSTAWAWAEEQNLEYYDPFDTTPIESRATYSPTVSSIHFDMVGALAIAAGYSVEDAAIIQAYSQATDSEELPAENPVYTFDADPANYPTPPPISQVSATPYCPDPANTADFATMGNYDAAKDQMQCSGCFTSRYGPYGVFFHFPHARADELYATRDWALGRTPVLTGEVIYAYSSTAKSFYQEAINIYESSNCFVSRTVRIDTGSIQAGSLEALGIYVHSLGDNHSHGDCIAAADAEGKLFAAHVTVGPMDPLAKCSWETSHKVEFGPSNSDTDRTFEGILAVYDALVTYGEETGRNVYKPIPVHDANDADGQQMYTYIYDFVHNTGSSIDPDGPMNRRLKADELRNWALQTRTQNSAYWPQLFLPAILSE